MNSYDGYAPELSQSDKDKNERAAILAQLVNDPDNEYLLARLESVDGRIERDRPLTEESIQDAEDQELAQDLADVIVSTWKSFKTPDITKRVNTSRNEQDHREFMAATDPIKQIKAEPGVIVPLAELPFELSEFTREDEREYHSIYELGMGR